MSPLSGRLCLLTLVALILPSRGQTSEETTSSSSVDQISVDTPHVTDTDNPEVHSTSPIPTWNIDETTESQTVVETSQETQQPTETDTTLLMTDPGTGSEKAHAPEGTTQFPRNDSPSPVRDNCVKVQTPKPPGSKEEDPFYYDNTTLRRRGLLVAAVLFITGIIILTSGKCRHLSGICRNHHRAYRVVNTRCPGKEEAASGTQA